jgi:hypothetical protein
MNPPSEKNRAARFCSAKLAGAVETRVKDANQKFLTIAGGCFRRANVEFNPRHAMQQSNNPAPQQFWVEPPDR